MHSGLVAALVASIASAWPCGNSSCPPPRWAPEWSLTYSTTCNPGSGCVPDLGPFIPPPSQPWGFVDLDWAVGSGAWNNDKANGTMDATLVSNCKAIKLETGNRSRCAVYHNTELCLEASESQRALLNDPSKAHLFLQYTDGRGNKNGTIYIERGGPGRQAFYDYRVPETTAAVIEIVMTTTGSPWVDATFMDDPGFPAEHSEAPVNMNLSATEVQEINAATTVALSAIFNATWAAGKYITEGFYGVAALTPEQCSAAAASRCGAAAEAWMARASFYPMNTSFTNQSLAYFLATRGPNSVVGFRFESDQRNWMPEFLWDVGVPLGDCAVIAPGVFSRSWTYGNATLDCNAFTGTIPVHSSG